MNFPKPRPPIELASCQKFAEAEFCENLTEYAAWLDNVGAERLPAPWFCCSMSAKELLKLTLHQSGPFLTGLDEADIHRTVYMANQELRRRYLQDRSADIALRVDQLMEGME